jgi:GDP-D-mannose 3',5'-epimerase
MKNVIIDTIIKRLESENLPIRNWYSKKRILVTGGAGFIGSWLTRALAALNSQVYVVDNLWRGSMDNLHDEDGAMVIPISEQFLFGDLQDYQIAKESIKKSQPDIVFHLADIVAGINYVFSHEPFIFRTNMLINSNVFFACQEENVPRVVYLGTACSYPKEKQLAVGGKPLCEDQVYPANPESGYGWSKLMGEYELQLLAKYTKIDIGILRLHNVYGPRSILSKKRSQVIPSLIRKAICYPKEEFIVWGSGKQTRDFIFVGDVIDALLRLPLKGMNNGVIQVSSAQETSVADLASTIVKISGKTIPITFDNTKPEGDIGRCGDYSKASTVLGWKHFTSMEEGLRLTYEWAQKYIRDGKLDD